MMDWYTIEWIGEDTFSISEYRHREQSHCYLLTGRDSALLIDTGLGVSNGKNVVDQLTALPVRVVTTHIHWDHIGGHRFFSDISVFEAEYDWLNGGFPLSNEVVKRQLGNTDEPFPSDFSLDSYHVFQGLPTNVFHDEDWFDLGGRRIQALHTPGHSPGHCCFFEPERGFLFSGDLIYQGCLDAFYPSTDPVAFFHSVCRVNKLPVRRVFPGHGTLNVDIGILDEIQEAFSVLQRDGKLTRGGLFDFGKFQIHI